MKTPIRKLSIKLAIVLILAFIIASSFFYLSYKVRHNVIGFIFKDSIQEDIERTKSRIEDIDILELYETDDKAIMQALANEIHKETPSVGFFITVKNNENKAVDTLVNVGSDSLKKTFDNSFYILYYFQDNDDYRERSDLAIISDTLKIRLEIYSLKTIEYLNYYLIITILLTILIFVVIFVGLVHIKIKYIELIRNRIHILQDGDFTEPIPLEGMDELGRLSQQIDLMRKSFLDNEISQNRLVNANRTLIKKMENNLDKPLLKLEDDLQLLSKISEENSTSNNLLLKSCDKAEEINNKVNELFDYFFVRKANVEKTEIPVSQVLEELNNEIMNLESNSYIVNINIETVEGTICANIHQVKRMFYIIFVYIKKNVDKNDEINLKWVKKGGGFELSIITTVNKTNMDEKGFLSDVLDNIIIDNDGDKIYISLMFEG